MAAKDPLYHAILYEITELDRFKLKGSSRPVPPTSVKSALTSTEVRQTHLKPDHLAQDSNGSLDLSIHNPEKKRKNHKTGQGDLRSSARDAVIWLLEVLRADEQRQAKEEKQKPACSRGQCLRSIRFQKRDEKMGIGILSSVGDCLSHDYLLEPGQ